MLQIIETINTAVNNFIWGVPAMVCIFGVGLYLSIRTNFLQIRKFPYAIKTTLGRIFRKRDASDGAITPFQAVCTALAATVGTGNIAGVAGAIAIGGPGAIFWMWVSALFGMCTKYAEVTLAVHYREINANGELVGGPMYYIKNGLSKKWHWLAYLFAAFGVLTVFGTGNATQVNTITTAINSALLNYNVISESAVSWRNQTNWPCYRKAGSIYGSALHPSRTGSYPSEHSECTSCIRFYFQRGISAQSCNRRHCFKYVHQFKKRCFPWYLL